MLKGIALFFLLIGSIAMLIWLAHALRTGFRRVKAMRRADGPQERMRILPAHPENGSSQKPQKAPAANDEKPAPASTVNRRNSAR